MIDMAKIVRRYTDGWIVATVEHGRELKRNGRLNRLGTSERVEYEAAENELERRGLIV